VKEDYKSSYSPQNAANVLCKTQLTNLVTVKGTNHITLVGTLSPVLFFKGSSVEPIKRFVDSLYGETNK